MFSNFLYSFGMFILHMLHHQIILPIQEIKTRRALVLQEFIQVMNVNPFTLEGLLSPNALEYLFFLYDKHFFGQKITTAMIHQLWPIEKHMYISHRLVFQPPASMLRKIQCSFAFEKEKSSCGVTLVDCGKDLYHDVPASKKQSWGLKKNDKVFYRLSFIYFGPKSVEQAKNIFLHSNKVFTSPLEAFVMSFEHELIHFVTYLFYSDILEKEDYHGDFWFNFYTNRFGYRNVEKDDIIFCPS